MVIILYYYISGRGVYVRVWIRVCTFVQANVYAYVCAWHGRPYERACVRSAREYPTAHT